MTKKFWGAVLLSAISMASSAPVKAAVTIDGIVYDLLPDNTVIVKKPSSTTISGAVTIPATITIDGIARTVRAIDEYAFDECESITSVTLPSTIDSIGACAFNNCTAMGNINLGATSLRYLGASSFMYCSSLKSISIPASVTEIANNAFMEALALREIKVASGNKVYTDIDGVLYTISKKTLLAYPVGKGTDYVVPEGTDSIGKSAFCQARTVRNVTFPESLTVIADAAFFRVDSLQKIQLPPNLKKIGSSAFADCRKATGEIILPASLTSVAVKSFYYTAITKLEIPGTSFKIIPTSFAQFCTKLRELKIGEGITSVSDYAFSSCAISEVKIPNTVTKLGTACFEGCTLLKNVTLGSSLKTISYRVFNKITGLSTITSFAATPPTVSSSATYPAFPSTVYANAILYVSESALSVYQEAAIWKDFQNIVKMSNNVASTDQDDFSIMITSHGIEVIGTQGKLIEIYNTQGASVYSGREEYVSLSPGLYFVVIGSKSRKVMIR